MSDKQAKKRLGRGLAALIGEIDGVQNSSEAARSGQSHLPIEQIHTSRYNPRRKFSEDELQELAQSIKSHGIVQPVVVRPLQAADSYEIIAGERRWRAAQLAGLDRIPVVIKSVDDRTALELAIVENVQRSDLNPMEEASGFQLLMDQYGYSQNELASVVGKSRSHIANTVRLLNLPEKVKNMVVAGDLSAGHGRALLTVDDPVAVAESVIRKDLSVRQAEQLVQQMKARPAPEKKSAPVQKDADTAALEKLLCEATGLDVLINRRGEGGTIKIGFQTLDQLDSICHRLKAH